MKSEKGVTLITLIIYLILLVLVLSILSIVSQYFFGNVNRITDIGKYLSGFNKFNMYFIEDVKNNTETYSVTNNEIIFKDGTTYTFENTDIYRNKVKICDNIYNVTFSKKDEEDSSNFTKKIVTVEMTIKSSKLFNVSHEYVLRYW